MTGKIYHELHMGGMTLLEIANKHGLRPSQIGQIVRDYRKKHGLSGPGQHRRKAACGNSSVDFRNTVPPYELRRDDVPMRTSIDYAKLQRAAAALADQHIGVRFSVYDSKHDLPVYTRLKKFADDDPVWEAPVDVDGARLLWASVIQCAIDDLAFKGVSTGLTENRKQLEAGRSRAYLQSRKFNYDAEFLGIDPDVARERIGL